MPLQKLRLFEGFKASHDAMRNWQQPFSCEEELVIDGHCSSSEAATSNALDEACYPDILQMDQNPKIHMRRFATFCHCWRWSFGAKKRKIFSSRTPRDPSPRRAGRDCCVAQDLRIPWAFRSFHSSNPDICQLPSCLADSI